MLAVLCLGLLVVGIDGTIVNVALPTLVRELDASNSQLQWIVDAYTIVFASFLLIAGNTGDRLSRKWCFVVGLVVFGVGSFLCSTAGSANELIVLRGIQGFGAAFIMPATLSILTNVFPDAGERARAIAIWAGVSGLGVAIGPLTGGFLLEHFHWGAIFLVNVPVILLTIVGVIVLVPDSKDEHAPRLDVVGTVLFTVGLISLLYGIIEGPGHGWTSPTILAAFGVGIVLLAAFVGWELHTDHPILDVTFFANPRFTAASLAVTFVFFAMFGSLFFVSQYLQFVLGYSALRSGAALLPVAAVLMVAAPTSAKLVARFGTKLVVSGGLFTVAAALLLFSRVTVDSGYPLVAATLVVIGLGMGLAMAPATDSIMGSLPPEKAGVGSAMNDTTREIGGALGVAIMGSITSAVYGSQIAGQAFYQQLRDSGNGQLEKAAEVIHGSIGGANLLVEQLPANLRAQYAPVVTKAANEAFVHALDRTVVVGAAVAILGALVALIWLPARADGEDRAFGVLLDGTANRIEGTDVSRGITEATLGLLADAGMSSLSYSGIASRSGISTATIKRYWTSRVDAVTDAVIDVFAANRLPHTDDLRADLREYLRGFGEVLADPRAREVTAALMAEASTDPVLADALDRRVTGPRRADLESRLARGPQRLRSTPAVAADLLTGSVFGRVLMERRPVDDAYLDEVLDAVLAGEGEPTVDAG